MMRVAGDLLVMPRHLFIVARGVPGLYEVLTDQFADDADVIVILDRRMGERRAQPTAPHDERRKQDRRVRPFVDEELRLRSHAILTL